MGEDTCSGELCSDLMLRLREGRCGGVEGQDWEGKEHPPLDILEMETRKHILKKRNLIIPQLNHKQSVIYLSFFINIDHNQQFMMLQESMQ